MKKVFYKTQKMCIVKLSMESQIGLKKILFIHFIYKDFIVSNVI